MDQLINLALPLILGAITVPVWGGFKRLSGKIDNLPPIAHQFAVLGVASVMTWGSGQLGVMLPLDLSMWTPETTEAALSAGMALAIHAGRKK